MPTPTMPCRCCSLFIGLPDVRLLNLDEVDGGLVMTIETTHQVFGCPGCGTRARVKDRDPVALVDLPFADKAMRTIWVKRRLACVDADCEVTTWTECDDRIAPPRSSLTSRAGRWVTFQVGAHARSVAEVAKDLGSSWHVVNDAVLTWGEALLEGDIDRVGAVTSLGLDEVAFAKLGERRKLHFATSIVDTGSAQLLEVTPGRGGQAPKRWINERSQQWREEVRWATLDLSGAFRSVFQATLPEATMVADLPFTWSALPTTRSMSAAGECRTRPSVTGAAKATPSIEADECSPWPLNAWTRQAPTRCEDCSELATREARWRRLGLRKKPFESSMPTLMSRPQERGSMSSFETWPTPSGPSKSAHSAAPSRTGETRSLLGTRATPPTDQLRQPTI